MISVVMPFWRRQKHLEHAEAMYESLYGGVLDYEIVVVDDGSPEPAVSAHEKTRILRMPDKTEPLNPCIPINYGVRWAKSDILVLTNPEITHKTPVLQQLVDEWNRQQDGSAHIGAAVWSEDNNGWLVHPDHFCGHGPVPENAALNHMVLFGRALWDAAGGFDERYRPHPGWDDNDFLWRCYAAGATFTTLRDAVAGHHATPSGWKGHAHNERLFFETWPQALQSA